jgi:hypothetical protein
VLGRGLRELELQMHPAFLGDVAQDGIPVLRVQHRASLIDDAERVALLRVGRGGADRERESGKEAGDARPQGNFR